ncbi:hypothetical protein GOP47_0007417 [Adiantum capillus-veneris]|uniref:NTF2 domain-containing protein n=1 Tax=Adiantum capillus-veneris TaxID=13818 RepID=A0A9D4V0U9_ADICA|nr:hypothetical protein GOP47_0007417 [Adiantum capillus-veneris]
MDPKQIGRAFVDHYYSIFDTNRVGLVSLYQDGSMLMFEDEKLLGTQEHTLNFNLMFHSLPNGAGSFYVHDDIFRLNYS